ncbi:MAG: NAD(P)H-dependent oxidoreductase [Lachnospiraceae bacterium]|nr:NAD(P)H-dependent oxidoreductase [Lachnospiraceae bacterium]
MVIRPKQGEDRRLEKVLLSALKEGAEVRMIRTAEELETSIRHGAVKGQRILFAAALGKSGINLTLYAMLEVLRLHPDCLKGSVAGILVDAEGEFHTKSIGREIARTANEAGCWFVGRPLTEGTGSLRNYRVAASNHGCSLYEAYLWSARDLVRRILSFQRPVYRHPKLLCLHSCNPSTSNTLQLWREVQKNLSGQMEIREISLRDGTVTDCAGCSYEMCMYFSRNSSCFYGGPIVEEVYPALQECSGLILLCPNYNDALGANLTAFVNRLTALFRRKPFADKYLFALIVSGYSGGDILARQLIGGLNMNKSFILPGNFALMETANEPGSVLKNPDIQQKAGAFAQNMLSCFLKNDIL